MDLGRRAFLSALAVGLSACSDCARREGGAPARSVPEKPLPPMPEAGPDAAPGARGEVGTEIWSFDDGGRACVIVPSWRKDGERLPMLVALHGRGEAVKGPAEGVMGWPRDYALLRAIGRVCHPPLDDADFEGFSDPKRLAEINGELAQRPFAGLVVVCPYLVDLKLEKTQQIRDYGRYLLESVIPRAKRELPVIGEPRSIGIDGVSLGGAVALRVGLDNPTAFGDVGTLQAALQESQVPELTDLAKAARAKNPDLKLRLLTSHDDYFHDPITHLSQSLRAAGIAHDYADVPGPHDYPFNRGPGSIEMLVWHDRMLARA